ncbi:MAG: lipid-binding SYLF domain-containing protein [Bryobacteraceae bacterium]
MKRTWIATTIAALVLAGSASSKDKPPEAVKRIEEARVVFNEIMTAGDKSIPLELFEKAHCVAIIPGLKKGGFLVGAKYGKGVLMCRRPGGGWTGPGTVRVEGGSVGLQIGGGEVDVVLLVMNERGAEKMLKSEFTIGGSAAAMAGPVGRSVQAETDAYMQAEILGYSRSRGVFAGLALEGSTLREDSSDNEAVYGKRLSNEEILAGRKAPVPAAARPLVVTLNRYSMWEKK